MTRSLEVLLRSLQLAGLEIDAEAALDSLWLGREIRAKERATDGSRTSTSVDTIGHRDSKPSTVPIEDAGKRPSSAKKRDSLSLRTGDFATPVATSRPTAAAPARTVTLARAAALPASRDLIKALRPLRRRVVSPGAGVLDVDATVRRAAEEDLWFPSFASARERWLDVLLVADHGMSMILWKDTVDEFERLLRNSGAFRSVRSWWLESDADTPAITARGRGPVPPTPERLARLTRGAGRSVILVVSDCVGARWHDGAIPRLVGAWSRILPVALMQVTPEWFWARTALGATIGSRFRSAVPAAVNHRFRWDASALGAMGASAEEEKTLLRVPATTLTADAVARLAGLIAGVGREWAPGVVFDLTWDHEEEESAPGPVVTAQERVARFRALASKAAQRLAAGFAASPVRTLGVLRLLRRDLLPDASPFAEAEVVLGGIVRVRREEARWDLGADVPLEFVPGVQQLLLDGAIAGDVLRVLTHAAAVAQTGVGPTFTSWLENPSSGTAQLDPAESAFAAAAAQVLERLGGAYAKIVKSQPTVFEEQPLSQNQMAEGEPTSVFPAFVGYPHQLPCPQVLHGRREDLFQVNRWVNEDFPRQVLSVVGPSGIGKSALAGQTVLNWREHWPDDEPFVWNFQQDPTSGEAYGLLRSYAGVPLGKGSGSAEELLEAMSRRGRSLVIFDGIDGLSRSGELDRVLGDVAALATSGSARVLVTSREPLRDGAIPVEQLLLGPLDRAAVESLVVDLLQPAHGSEWSDRDKDLLTDIAQELGGGNPLVIKTLLAQTATLSAEALVEELISDRGERSSIAPDQLPTILEQVDQAARARELSATGASCFTEGNMREAFKAFNNAVSLRSRLPSRRLRADAFFDRGRTSLALAEYDRANADLADAAGIYRMLSEHRELVVTLEALAEARERTGRDDESMSHLREALELSRTHDDSAGVVRVLLRLAAMQTQRGSLEEAVTLLHEAIEAAMRASDALTTGFAFLQMGRLRQRMADPGEALAAVQQAVGYLSKVDEPALLAEAFGDLATLFESSANYGDARRALGRLRELRPDQAVSIDERIERLASLDSVVAPQAQRQATAPPAEVLEGDDRVLSVEFLVSGRVSGVFFRSFVQQCAAEIGLEGVDAENLPDGRVRVRAIGPWSRLSLLESRLRQGPPGATVAAVDTNILAQVAPGDEKAEAKWVRERGGEAPRRLGRAVIAIGVARPSADLPELHAATESAHRVAEWAASQGIPAERITLLTDESAHVTARRVFDAVRTSVDLDSLDQLIIYFAGYAINVRHAEYWLLTQARDDPQASVDVEGSKLLARSAGIPHVVFISDACRASPYSISPQAAVGQTVIFPNVPTGRSAVTIDRFTASLVGHSSEEVRDVGDAVRRYRAAYTTVLLSALSGGETSIQDEEDDGRVVRPRALASYLSRAVPEYLHSVGASIGAMQEPDAIIESGPDAWLARFD